MGEQGILDELRAVGIEAFGGPHDNDKRVDFSQPKDMEHDTEVNKDRSWRGTLEEGQAVLSIVHTLFDT